MDHYDIVAASRQRAVTATCVINTTGSSPCHKRRARSSALDKTSSSFKKSCARRTKTHDFYCCRCGRHNFATITAAKRHEEECDGTINRKGPWLCSVCGKADFKTSQAFTGHWRCCNKGPNVTKSCLSLKPNTLEMQAGLLSDFNQLIISSIELFVATEVDCKRQMVGSGRRRVSVGNVGIRCWHCSKSGVMIIGSTSYATELKTMPHNMYTMVTRHLLHSCKNVSEDLKNRLMTTKKDSLSQSVKKGGLGLPTYLRMLNEHLKLTDDGERNGVRCTLSKVSEGKQNDSATHLSHSPELSSDVSE